MSSRMIGAVAMTLFACMITSQVTRVEVVSLWSWALRSGRQYRTATR